ncbi:hypothetical protein WJX73_007707 [Symbiochloris irregularis]|uniref:Uncharacterized protein n=1 Tax=Symbiochloris irregularis TaxID=706552 RepID=A0AAW1NGP9_9CHLO
MAVLLIALTVRAQKLSKVLQQGAQLGLSSRAGASSSCNGCISTLRVPATKQLAVGPISQKYAAARALANSWRDVRGFDNNCWQLQEEIANVAEAVSTLKSALPPPDRTAYAPPDQIVDNIMRQVEVVGHQHWGREQLSRGHLVMQHVQGPAGSGKTELLHQLLPQMKSRAAQADPASILKRMASAPLRSVFVSFTGAVESSSPLDECDLRPLKLGAYPWQLAHCLLATRLLCSGVFGMPALRQDPDKLSFATPVTVLFCLDEWQLVHERLVVEGLTPEQATDVCKEMVYSLADFNAAASGISLAKQHGIALVPVMAGTSLTAQVQELLLTRLDAEVHHLPPLSPQQARQLLRGRLLTSAPATAWAGHEETVDVLLASGELTALLENVGFNPRWVLDYVADALKTPSVVDELISLGPDGIRTEHREMGRLLSILEKQVEPRAQHHARSAIPAFGGFAALFRAMLLILTGTPVTLKQDLAPGGKTVEQVAEAGFLGVRRFKDSLWTYTLQMHGMLLRHIACELSSSFDQNGAYISSGIQLRSLIPPTQLNLNQHGEAMEDMVAARELAAALVAQYLNRTACTLGQVLPGARSNDPTILAIPVVQRAMRLRQSAQPLFTTKEFGLRTEQANAVIFPRGSAYHPCTAPSCPIDDPEALVLLDGPGGNCPEFDMRRCMQTLDGQPPLLLAYSIKRAQGRNLQSPATAKFLMPSLWHTALPDKSVNLSNQAGSVGIE